MTITNGPVSVLIVDDQELVRMGLRTLLEAEDGFSVAGEAADGLAAVEEARRRQPDVILMDIRMPGIDGIEATRRIAADPDLAGTKVVVLTTFQHDEYVIDAIRHGASGFVLKATPPRTLLEAIRTVVDGGALLDAPATKTLIERFLDRAPRPTSPHPRLGDLTDRERELMTLAAQGLNNQEIAAELVLSPATVRTHISRAMVKLGARDRAQLVVFAYQSGLA